MTQVETGGGTDEMQAIDQRAPIDLDQVQILNEPKSAGKADNAEDSKVEDKNEEKKRK